MEFRDTWFPLVVTVRGGYFGARELLEMAEGYERLFRRGAPYAVLNVSRVDSLPPDFRERSLLTDWESSPRVRWMFEKLCVGVAAVPGAPGERQALFASHDPSAPTRPQRVVRTVSEGTAYCVTQLLARGVVLPKPSASFESDVNRVLGAMPLAGSQRSGVRAALTAQGWGQWASIGTGRLESLADADGSVRVGWVAEGVLWSGFEGLLPDALCEQFATRLDELMSSRPLLSYFHDGSRLKSYDLRARATVGRVLDKHQQRFITARILSWEGNISPPGQAILQSLGGRVKMDWDRHSFERELARAAPAARQIIQVSSASAR